MSALRRTVPLGAGESPASFASRLAAGNRLPVRDFCRDWLVTFQDVVDGKPNAIAVIADKGGVDPAALAANAIVAKGERRFEFCGEQFTRSTLRRARLHACPACLAEDVKRHPDLRPNLAAYGRAIWLIDAVRTCPVHDMVLVEIGHGSQPSDLHDFAMHAGVALDRFGRLGVAADQRAPGPLEFYILNRIEGRRQSPFLDGLDLYAAIQTVEALGAVAAFGHAVSWKALDGDAWWKAGAAGFEIAAPGKVGIHAFLDRLMATTPVTGDGEGPQARYGKSLYDWIARGSPDPAFDPLRDVVRAHIVDNMPLAAGQVVLGKPIEKRRWHSAHTAAIESRLHPKRLRKLLAATGAIPASQAGLTNNRVLLAPQAVEEVVAEAADALPVYALGEYANIPRVQRRIITQEGFITPVGGGATPGIDPYYARAEVDAFLARLTDGATAVAAAPDGAFSIPDAAHRACCAVAEVLRLILGRKLRWVGRLEGERGYMAALVDIDEVRAAVRGADHGGIKLRDVEKELGTTTLVVKALVEGGHLTGRVAVNPINRCPQTVVDRDVLERFKATYVSLHQLAQERRRHFKAVLNALRAEGVEPAFKPDDVHATFYRRADVGAVR